MTENRTIPDIGNFSSIIGNSIPQKECVTSFHRAKKKKRKKEGNGNKKKKRKSKGRKKKNEEKKKRETFHRVMVL